MASGAPLFLVLLVLASAPPILSPEGSRNVFFCDAIDRGDTNRYPPREEVPLPTQPPYTAFVGNLPFELTEFELEQHFGPHKVCTCFAKLLLKYGRRLVIHRFPSRGHNRSLESQADRTVLFWDICTSIPCLTVGMHIAARRLEHCLPIAMEVSCHNVLIGNATQTPTALHLYSF